MTMSVLLNPYALGSGAVSPLTTSDFWVKADAIGGLADGDPVTTWSDSSGNSRDMTQSTAASKPTYKTGIVNSKPVVRFDGTDDYMTTAAAITTVTDNWTMVMVAKDTLTTVERAPFMNGDGSVNGYGIANRVNPTGEKGYLRGGQQWHASSVAGDTAWTIYVLRRTSGTTRLYVNGGASVMSTASSPNTPSTRSVLGSHEANSAKAWGGDMAEAAMWDTSLSDADVNSVGSELGTKYALTWTNI